MQPKKNIRRVIFDNLKEKRRMHIKSQQQERTQDEASHKHKRNPRELEGLHPIKRVVTPTTTQNGNKKKNPTLMSNLEHVAWYNRTYPHEAVQSRKLGQVLVSCHGTTYYDPTWCIHKNGWGMCCPRNECKTTTVTIWGLDSLLET